MTGGYYGLQTGRLVYANNVNGAWRKIDSTLGTGNGYPYNWSSPYHLMLGYDGKLRMYYSNMGWYAYGGPLYMRVLEGTTWTSPIIISNTNDGGADSQNNLWSFTKKTNGQIQVYLSDGWRCTGNGCTETFYNNIRVFTEGANYAYTLTKNIPNTRWYYENKNQDSIKVTPDGKSVYVNNTLLNTLSGSEIIRNNTWIDNANQFAIENTSTNSRVFNRQTGQSLVNNTGQYIIPANGFQIAIDYSVNPRRLYTIHQGNIQPISANFNNTNNNLSVSLSNTSTNATSYSWNFGNGQTSNQQNPTITYNTAGTYNVCLTATNSCGSVQVCKQITVTCPLPTANFTNAINGSSVSFTNTSTNATSYSWNYGNGQTSTQQNPTITYNTSGIYNVCLTATNSCGQTQTCKNIQVSMPTPNLQCYGQPVINPNPIVKGSPANMSLSVINNGQGVYSGMLYLMWRNNTSGFKLDSSNVTLSNGQTKTLSMTSTGILSNAGTWFLRIEDINGTIYCSTSVVVVDCNLPVSNFNNMTNGLSVSFTNTSTHATSYSWNFGNGQTSTQQNPTITYNTAGTYNACLTATNSCGSVQVCKQINVTCLLPTASFTNAINGSSVNFTNTSTNATTYSWNFGNGQTSTQQNPSTNYVTSSNYNVCLRATNSCGFDDSCKNVNIVITAIKQNQLDNLISIFPNPSTGTFTVKMDKSIDKIAQLSIYNLEGKIVHQEQLDKHKTEITTQNLASGVYFINIQLSENEFVKHKLVIMH